MPGKEIKLPGIGEVPRWSVYAGVAAVAGMIVLYSYRQKKNAAAAAAAASTTAGAGTVTDPAGNTCTALDPASGYCPGTPEDQAYQEEESSGYGSEAGFGTDSGYITDSNGASCVALDPATGLCPVTTTAAYTTNQQWVTAAENQLGDTSVVQAALGYALSGQPVTAAQASLYNEAVGLLGPPPQGAPPLNVTGTAASSSGTSTGATAIPNVVGMDLAEAQSTLTAAGFGNNVSGGSSGTVFSQTPQAGGVFPTGGTVDIAVRSSATVPNTVGMKVSTAESAIDNAGFNARLNGNPNGTIFSQTPSGGTFPVGGTVDIAAK